MEVEVLPSKAMAPANQGVITADLAAGAGWPMAGSLELRSTAHSC